MGGIIHSRKILLIQCVGITNRPEGHKEKTPELSSLRSDFLHVP